LISTKLNQNSTQEIKRKNQRNNRKKIEEALHELGHIENSKVSRSSIKNFKEVPKTSRLESQQPVSFLHCKIV